MTNLNFLSASEMASRVRQREVSSRELVAAHLEQIDRLNPHLNALVHIDREGALRAAAAADDASKQGVATGPLHGVPITIKSSIDVAGWPCEAGSRLNRGRVAERDAPLVRRLRKAGAVLLGNTNAPEFMMAYETVNSLHGRTNNPWDLARTPGGSSGGEAAALAAGLSAAGVGSDGGGSIRIPAHFSGVCGLKPTPGRIPATGHTPPSAGPFAIIGVVGPMARTVGDLATMFAAMAGPDDGDPVSAPAPVQSLNEATLRALHIGYFEEEPSAPVTPETRAAVQRVATALERDGFSVSRFTPLAPDGPDHAPTGGAGGLREVQELWWNIFGRAGAMIFPPLVADRESELSPLFKEYLDLASAEGPLTGKEFLDTWIGRDALRARLLDQMNEFQVFICPVCSIPAFFHGERLWDVGGRSVRYLNAMSYTQWFNLLGNPAASVPVARSPEGMPIGIQVVGRPYEDEAVLAVAGAIERLCGGWCRPPLAG